MREEKANQAPLEDLLEKNVLTIAINTAHKQCGYIGKTSDSLN
jgi:hypothetical protein